MLARAAAPVAEGKDREEGGMAVGIVGEDEGLPWGPGQEPFWMKAE